MSKIKILKLGRTEWEVVQYRDSKYYCTTVGNIRLEVIYDSKVFIQPKSSGYTEEGLKSLTKAINQAKKLLAHLREQHNEAEKVQLDKEE